MTWRKTNTYDLNAQTRGSVALSVACIRFNLIKKRKMITQTEPKLLKQNHVRGEAEVCHLIFLFPSQIPEVLEVLL